MDTILRVSGTGRRPKYQPLLYTPEGYRVMVDVIIKHLAEIKYNHPKIEVNSGGALGFDMALASAAYMLDIPFNLYLPCPNQEVKWKSVDQTRYRKMLKLAKDVHIYAERYSVGAMYGRNTVLVDSADMMIVYWDEVESGGTWDAIEKAGKRKLDMINVWDAVERKLRWM